MAQENDIPSDPIDLEKKIVELLTAAGKSPDYIAGVVVAEKLHGGMQPGSPKWKCQARWENWKRLVKSDSSRNTSSRPVVSSGVGRADALP